MENNAILNKSTHKRTIEIFKLTLLYGVSIVIMAFSFTTIPRINPLVGNQFFIMIAVLLCVAIDNLFTNVWKNYHIFGNIRKSLRLNIFLMGLVMFIYIMIYTLDWYPKGDLSILNRGVSNPLYIVLYIFFLVPLQQLFVWGDFRTRLKHLQLPISIEYIIISIFYASTHLFYPENQLIIAATFTIGLFWSYIQDRSNSIVGNIVCHIIFGLGAFMLNLA